MFESVFGLRERWPRYTDFSLIFCSFAPVYRCDVATSCPGVRRLPFQNLQGSWKALNIFSYLSLLNRLLKTSWPSRQLPPLFLWNFALFLKNSSEPPGRPIWNFPDPPVNVPGKLNGLCLIIPSNKNGQWPWPVWKTATARKTTEVN